MALTKIKTQSINDDAITTAKINNNAVTDAKVADDITAGAASTAATLATARNINGVSFNGSSAITVTAAAGTLTGATLASGVTASSLTSVGTLSSLTLGGDLTLPQKIVHSGDTDTYLSFGTDSLSLYTGGTNVVDFIYGNIYIKGNNKALTGYTTGGGAKELIKIDDSDIVQIGEGQDVSITGDGARFYVKSADEELISIGRAGSSGASLDQGYIRMKSGGSNKVAFHTAGDSYINGGSLGIGTDSPDSLLHAKVTTNTSQNIRIQNDDSMTTIGVSSDGYSFHTYQHSLYWASWDGSTWSTKARLDNDGQWCFGGTTPNIGGWNSNYTVLTLKGKAANYGGTLELANLDSTGNYFGSVSFVNLDGGSSVVAQARFSATRDGADDASAFVFETEPTGGAVAERMRIDSAGNVGIGLSDTSVNNKFQVQVGTDHRIGFWGGSTYSAIQSVNDANSAQKALRFDATTYNFYGTSTAFNHGITSGTHLIEGLSNYTGLTLHGSGGSRPQVKFTNVNNGDLGSIYATEGSALSFQTGTSLSTALTLDSEQSMHINRRLSHNGLNVYVKDTDVASSSGTTFDLLRSWHDTANWGQGMYLVEIFEYYYSADTHGYASYHCTYGYGSGTTVVEQVANTGNINAPTWTSETTISGNLKRRDLQLAVGAYKYCKVRITTPDGYTSNIDNNNNNTVYIYP